MLIVSGKIIVSPGARDDFLAMSRDAIETARRTAGCRDFIVAAAPIEPDRINIYEEWESADALERHFGTPHMAAFQKALPALLAGPVSIDRYEATAAP